MCKETRLKIWRRSVYHARWFCDALISTTRVIVTIKFYFVGSVVGGLKTNVALNPYMEAGLNGLRDETSRCNIGSRYLNDKSTLVVVSWTMIMVGWGWWVGGGGGGGGIDPLHNLATVYTTLKHTTELHTTLRHDKAYEKTQGNKPFIHTAAQIVLKSIGHKLLLSKNNYHRIKLVLTTIQLIFS